MTENNGPSFQEKFALVSERVMRDGHAINALFRERPIFAEDSGWRFFAGDEEGEFIANPDNTGCYPLGEVLAREPHVAPLLEREIGAAFERNATGAFEDVTGKQLHD